MNTIFDSLKQTIDNLDRKKFYLMIAIGSFCIYLLHGFLIYRFYSKRNELYELIETMNEQRKKEILTLLTRGKKIQMQKTSVEAMLKEKEDDQKINEYMESLIQDPTLNLSNKYLRQGDLATIDIDARYLERTTTAEFEGLSIAEVTRLLQAIEKKARVYTKEIEIATSKKHSRAVDIVITIATLEQKNN